MRAFVTGATGFIGRHVVRKLRAWGDDVVALVRSPEKATDLRALGCELAAGDLVATEAVGEGVRNCELGYAPRDFETGLREMLDALRALSRGRRRDLGG